MGKRAETRAFILQAYGMPASGSLARAWQRWGQPKPIRSHRQYVGICRRIARSLGLGLCNDNGSSIDYRLVAVGFQRVSPSRWVGGELGRFVAYWKHAAPRDLVVGSCYNPSPDFAYAALRAGVPALAVKYLGEPILAKYVGGKKLPRRLRRLLFLAAKAASRTSLPTRDVEKFSLRGLATLGRLSPELQRAAIASIVKTDAWRKGCILPRDFPWQEIAKVHRGMQRSFRARVAWSSGQRQKAMMAPESLHSFFGIAPEMPDKIALRLCRGETPAQIADGYLTKREAAAWLREAPTVEPIDWLQRRLPAGTPKLRSIPVVRWLLDVQRRGAWESLTRERIVNAPGGETLRGRFIDRVDEIQDCDLDRGPATGVERAFESAAQRLGEQWLDAARRDHRVLQSLPPGWKLFSSSMHHLSTPASLAREGDEMNHCVGSYAPAVEKNQSVILSIRVAGQRSTVELSPRGEVRQHRGPKNTDPHPLCEKVLQAFLQRRINNSLGN